jgi:hypothetical protein
MMGACGYLISNQAVFFMSAALVVPVLVAVGCIRTRDIVRSSRPSSLKIGNGLAAAAGYAHTRAAGYAHTCAPFPCAVGGI